MARRSTGRLLVANKAEFVILLLITTMNFIINMMMIIIPIIIVIIKTIIIIIIIMQTIHFPKPGDFVLPLFQLYLAAGHITGTGFEKSPSLLHLTIQGCTLAQEPS